MEQKGLQPLRNLLGALELSRLPGILEAGASAAANARFQWHRSAALAKRIAGIDLLVGLTVYPDPLNNTLNLLGVELTPVFIYFLIIVVFQISPPNWQNPYQGRVKKHSSHWHSEKYFEKLRSVHATRSKRSNLSPQQQQAQVQKTKKITFFMI